MGNGVTKKTETKGERQTINDISAEICRENTTIQEFDERLQKLEQSKNTEIANLNERILSLETCQQEQVENKKKMQEEISKLSADIDSRNDTIKQLKEDKKILELNNSILTQQLDAKNYDGRLDELLEFMAEVKQLFKQKLDDTHTGANSSATDVKKEKKDCKNAKQDWKP